jgi:prophage regulatory protein
VKLPRTERGFVETDSIPGKVKFKKACHQIGEERTPIPDPARQLLSLRQVKQQVGASSASIWRWLAEGKFPRPIRLSPCERGKRVAWHAGEIYEWIAQRPRTDAHSSGS